MRGLINILRNKFEAVIIDSPPAGLLTDASALASMVDSTILVIKKGLYDRQFIHEVKEKLEKANATICGVILNEVDFKKDGHYYAGYGYGYIK